MTTDIYMQGPPGDQIKSVARAARILDAVGAASPPGLSVHAIAKQCGMGSESTYHYIRTLLYEGYLQRWHPGTYTLGFGILDRAHDLARQLTVAQDRNSIEDIASLMLREPDEIKGHFDLAAAIIKST